MRCVILGKLPGTPAWPPLLRSPQQTLHPNVAPDRRDGAWPGRSETRNPKEARGHSCPMPLAPKPFGYSVRGQCRTERRKDRGLCNPKGIVSSSPATESARLPWVSVRAGFNPNGVVTHRRHRAATPWGWPTPPAFPRVASRTRQPWASGRNPFGIHLWNFRKALTLARL